MKTSLIPFLFFFPCFLWAQVVDSVAIRQVDSLRQVVRELTYKQDFDKALEVNSSIEKIVLEKIGRESAAYGNCCFDQGMVFYYMRNYLEAEKWHLESKVIREKVLGKDHPDYAVSLNNLASLYKNMGLYEKAEPLFQESKAVYEKVLGRDHSSQAMSLSNLADLYQNMGQYEKAEPLFQESKTVYEKALGKDHPDYAKNLYKIAGLYWNMGQYEKAEPLFQESKAIQEKVLGKDHPDYANSLQGLAILYYVMGQYEKAEPLFQESKTIYEKTVGREHPYYAWCLNNQASLYQSMGQYEKAELLFLDANASLEKTLDKDHPDYAGSLYNLAGLYAKMGQFEKAELLYVKSKAIREKNLGKDHPDYAISLNSLAVLFQNMGKYEKAESLYIEAKAILEKALGRKHPNYVGTLWNLASLYHLMGKYEKAESLYTEAKGIWEINLDKDHPDYTSSMGNLASLYGNIGQYEKAELLYLGLNSINNRLIERAVHHLSESELNNYLSMFTQCHNETLSFTQKTNREKLIPVCYDNSLFYKGFLLNAANQIRRLALSDPTSTEKYNRLKGYQRRLAAQHALQIAERDSALLVDLEEKANTLEKDLVRTTAGFGEAMRQVGWQEVQQQLKAGEAAVEFVHYKYFDKKETDSTMYAALLLRPGDEQPRFIPLFEEKQLDSLLQSNGGRKADYVNGLYSVAERGARLIGQPQKPLYELICQPLEKELEGINTVYFSPSGLLHRLNLGAIPITDEETLADKYRLVELGSTRQLVIPINVETAAQDAVLFGGIEYEMDSMAIASANNDLGTEEFASRGELSFTYSDSTLRGGTWQYLKWSDREVTTLAETLGENNYHTTLYKGYIATENVFKSIGQGKPSPRILHLATHGFFFPDPVDSGQSAVSSLRDEPVFKISDHPMIRSGLILAGGNHAWQTGKPLKPDMEDGILTAYEISQMNLSNTELVVLSACETGLGDIQGNEGVYGLQRAFKIAGAKYLIMSLWQVPDQETSIFMTTFYKNWIEGEMSIPEAFRTTQQEMRERFINPYQWAGFVLVE